MGYQIINGDALSVVKTLPENSVNTVITSPPYYGLRSYLPSDSPDKHLEVGLDESPERYIERLVEIFREIKRVLRDDGTCWVNLGDTYWSGGGQSRHHGYDDPKYPNGRKIDYLEPHSGKHKSIKPKDMIGIPWIFAFAMRNDGWYLRQDIIWEKPNSLPESVRDRCTKNHEYIFLFSKKDNYYFDYEAIREEAVSYDGRKDIMSKGSAKYTQEYFPNCYKTRTLANKKHDRWKFQEINGASVPMRNKRSVWTVNNKPTNIGHFASYPEELITPCVLAGSPEFLCPKCGKIRMKIYSTEKGEVLENYTGTANKDYEENGVQNPSDTKRRILESMRNIKVLTGYTDCGCGVCMKAGTVLDPFNGIATTGLAALNNNRNYIGIELSKEYCELSEDRIKNRFYNLKYKEVKTEIQDTFF